MGLYRCNKCGHLAEVAASEIGSSSNCPRCGHANTAYDTVFFVGKLLERYFALRVANAQNQSEASEGAGNESADKTPPRLEALNIYNTALIATDLQHGPLHDWFGKRRIRIQPNLDAVDTTGFFDEVALEIGNNYELFKPLLDQVRFAQAKSHWGIKVELGKYKEADSLAIVSFCRQLHEYSFFSRYIYQKGEKTIRLGIQESVKIQRFFNGEWLEWFALMQVLEICKARQAELSCARNLSISFANDERYELDVFFLLKGGEPVCIECKSGEFRESIDKYVGLKKKLGLDKAHFILCATDLTDEQARGLSTMYGLTFVNEQGLAPHLQGLLG